MARSYKPNKIKVDIGSYRHYWRGVKKIGKTTMFRDLVKEEYGDTKYGLLISMGNETGYKALNNLYADEAQNWKTFVEIVDDLVKNRKENEFKLVALDTVDELVSVAVKEAMDYHKEKFGKVAKSINDALGGYGAGRQFVTKLINDQISRLERAGYGLIFIGHTKLRDIKEKGESEAYQTLSSNLESSWDNIFADKADIIATFYVEKVVSDGKLKDKQRFIYFRDDGFIDCGSRLSGMPDKVPMTAQEYLKAFRQGVEASMDDFTSEEEIEKMKKEELAQKEKSAEKFIEKENSGKNEEEQETLETLRPKVVNLCVDLGGKSNEEMMKLLKKYIPNGNPNGIKDLEKLKELFGKLQEMNTNMSETKKEGE